MPWVRIHDGALSHPKLHALFDWRDPFHVWVWGLTHAQMHLTDGLIARDTVPKIGLKAVAVLVARQLWDEHVVGWKVHDYLDWNDCRELVKNRVRLNKHRQAFLRDPGLRQLLRDRDGNCCRYCGREVQWTDRKGSLGATYDHVDPYGDATPDNLVIACRGCNSRKSNRTIEAAGMTLRPIPTPSGSRSDLDPDLDRINRKHQEPNQTKPNQTFYTEKREKSVSLSRSDDPFTDPTITERAGRFLERYQDFYLKHRKGARYALRETRDYAAAVTLCRTWVDDARLDKLAVVFLTTNHQFADEGSRTVPQFLALASWCDGKLAEWEAGHAAAV